MSDDGHRNVERQEKESRTCGADVVGVLVGANLRIDRFDKGGHFGIMSSQVGRGKGCWANWASSGFRGRRCGRRIIIGINEKMRSEMADYCVEIWGSTIGRLRCDCRDCGGNATVGSIFQPRPQRTPGQADPLTKNKTTLAFHCVQTLDSVQTNDDSLILNASNCQRPGRILFWNTPAHRGASMPYVTKATDH